jgi:hypothetical protein
MRKYPKRIKRLLAEFVAEAYERDLRHALAELDQAFAEWRNGRISSADLSRRIHDYEKGPSRDLFKLYDGNPHDMVVAHALVTGILRWDEMPAELLEALAGPLNFYQSLETQVETD